MSPRGFRFTVPHCGNPRLRPHSPKQWEVFPPPQGPAPCSSAGGGRRTRAQDPAPEAPPTGLTGPASPAGLFFLFFFLAPNLYWLFSQVVLRILPEARASSAGAVGCSSEKAQGCAGPRLPADSPRPGEEEEGLAKQTDAAAPGKMAAAKSGAGGDSQPA